MLPHDRSATAETHRYELARRDRRALEVAFMVFVLLLTVLTVWAPRLLAIYAYIAFVLILVETLRRGVRRIGMSIHVYEAVELARAAPFCTLVVYMVFWLGATHLLLDTGALSAPFSQRITFGVSVLLSVLVLYSTYAQRADNNTATLLWLLLLLPTENTSPRTAPPLLTCARVFIALLTHRIIMERTEGRIAPSKWQESKKSVSTAYAAALGAQVSARRLVQTAWVFVVAPQFLLGSIVIVALNEHVSTAASPLPRQRTSPTVSDDDDDDEEGSALPAHSTHYQHTPSSAEDAMPLYRDEDSVLSNVSNVSNVHTAANNVYALQPKYAPPPDDVARLHAFAQQHSNARDAGAQDIVQKIEAAQRSKKYVID